MLGLFGALNMGMRALQAQQEGVEVAGHNLANANNPAYSRQQVVIQTSTPLPTSIGPEGTGADATAITRVRDTLLDQQIQNEASVTGSLQSQQTALQYGQTALGEQLQNSSSATGTSDVGSTGGLDSSLTGFFNAFQDLSTSPGSMTYRQEVISQAQQLASRFNQVDQQLSSVHDQLNQSLQTDVSNANQLLTDIAGLNSQIVSAQASGGNANDLLDLRQQKIEQLANLVNIQTATASDGSVNIAVSGSLLVAGANVQDTLQTYDAGGGQLLVQTTSSATPLTLTGGTIQGTIAARDGALKSLQDGLNTLATQLISQVNSVYQAGYDLNGHTGANFFTGTNASDIGVNATLVNDPSTLQASGTAGAAGDSQIALALARLANAKQAGLNNQTFSENYNGTIASLGFSLAAVNSQVSQQQTVQTMLQNQRSSVSGVSLDQEMTDLVQYQRAFQASAHLVSVIDQMLNDVVNLKQ